MIVNKTFLIGFAIFVALSALFMNKRGKRLALEAKQAESAPCDKACQPRGFLYDYESKTCYCQYGEIGENGKTIWIPMGVTP